MKKRLFDFPDKYKIVDEKYHFETWFDRVKGNYLRTGILDTEGNDTGDDPFMASFPHLLDIGIMGHCDHGLSGKCRLAGIQCYQEGGRLDLPNMSFEDFKVIADQCVERVHQFALGGRGDPDMHENFEDILTYSRSLGIIPNLTTSGYRLDAGKAKLIAKYCGAAAVSWYRNDYTYKAIELLVSAGITTNIHFVLGRDSIDEAIDLLVSGRLPKGVNRIIFLLFKPVGQGNEQNMLSVDDSRVKMLFSLFDDAEITSLVGYDSCSVPALINHNKQIDPQSFDSCEGARFSAYISSELNMTPCSFDRRGRYSVSLKDKSILEAWESREFDKFRQCLRDACPDCSEKRNCFGGCPIVPKIVLCKQRQSIFIGGKTHEV